MIRLVLLCLLAATQASAGAWPRGEGETFVSTAVEAPYASRSVDVVTSYASLYAEHGLAGDLTLGLDIGGDARDMSKAFGFLRWPVHVSDGPGVWALELGLGVSAGDFRMRPGVSYGRGFQLGPLSGWLGIDSRALISEGLKWALETDITLGLKPRPGHMIILQVQTAAALRDLPSVRIAPSYVIELTPGRHLELGMTAGAMDMSEVKLKIGLWHRF